MCVCTGNSHLINELLNYAITVPPEGVKWSCLKRLDKNYHKSAKTAHSKYSKHQYFEWNKLVPVTVRSYRWGSSVFSIWLPWKKKVDDKIRETQKSLHFSYHKQEFFFHKITQLSNFTVIFIRLSESVFKCV